MADLQDADPVGPCSVAFKEWAAVCEALAMGRQMIILRKGGIHEGREGFRVQHAAFWLYPTNFHQHAEQLAADALPLLEKVKSQPPPPGIVPIRWLAQVEQVIHLEREEQALALERLHVWSPETVKQRFHYRTPGLHLLVVRVFQSAQLHQITEDPEMAGCKSWVNLPQALPTDDLSPVLTGEQFTAARRALNEILTVPRA
jgi:hypothetical protein